MLILFSDTVEGPVIVKVHNDEVYIPGNKATI